MHALRPGLSPHAAAKRFARAERSKVTVLLTPGGCCITWQHHVGPLRETCKCCSRIDAMHTEQQAVPPIAHQQREASAACCVLLLKQPRTHQRCLTQAAGHPRTLLYSFNRCCADVMAASTESRLTRLLMLDAVPSSSPNIFIARDTWTAQQRTLGALTVAHIPGT